MTEWVLVPSEPTKAMWEAGLDADEFRGDSYTKVWCAMVEAAPKGPAVTRCTIREAGDELHIECRMSDGQKGAFVTVDAAFPELAARIAAFLNNDTEEELAAFSRAVRGRD